LRGRFARFRAPGRAAQRGRRKAVQAPAGPDRSQAQPRGNQGGLDPDSNELAQLFERVPDFAHLETRGLMTIAPGARRKKSRGLLSQLAQLARPLGSPASAAKSRRALNGMSGDFPLAIQEGATRIRVGTALFGRRTLRMEPE